MDQLRNIAAAVDEGNSCRPNLPRPGKTEGRRMQAILELARGLSPAGVEPFYSAATRLAHADFNLRTNNGFP